MITKNDRISESLKATRQRRKQQECKVFELKIDKSHLSQRTCEDLKRLFLEGKWLYNYVLSQEDVFNVSDKLKEVPVKVKDGMQTRELKTLGSQMKQSIVDGLHQNILNLSKAKKKGRKVGALNFVSHYDSIDLKQNGNTFSLNGGRIKIQNIKQSMRVRGINQLAGYDVANAKLLQKAGDYFIHVTCYRTKQEPSKPKYVVGTDFGLEHQLAISDGKMGLLVDYCVPFPDKLRTQYRRLSRMKKHSSNWYKQLMEVRKEFAHWTNRKKDAQNKICHELKEFTVIYQDDNLRGWQRIWGRKMLSTRIGGITARLKKSATSIQVDRFFPSTKECPRCHQKQDMSLADRFFLCPCGYAAQRDFKSATCIMYEGLKQIGTEYTEYTPAETEPLRAMMERLNTVPLLHASLVYETGSPTLLSMG
jgi:putative transposase